MCLESELQQISLIQTVSFNFIWLKLNRTLFSVFVFHRDLKRSSSENSVLKSLKFCPGWFHLMFKFLTTGNSFKSWLSLSWMIWCKKLMHNSAEKENRIFQSNVLETFEINLLDMCFNLKSFSPFVLPKFSKIIMQVNYFCNGWTLEILIMTSILTHG